MNTIVLGMKKIVTENAISKGFFVGGRIPQKDIAAIERAAGMPLQETSYCEAEAENLSNLVEQIDVRVRNYDSHPLVITTYELLIHNERYIQFAKNALKFMNIDAPCYVKEKERKICYQLKSYGTMTDEQKSIASLCEVMVNDDDDNSQEK